jgi:hypothetical protein
MDHYDHLWLIMTKLWPLWPIMPATPITSTLGISVIDSTWVTNLCTISNTCTALCPILLYDSTIYAPFFYMTHHLCPISFYVYRHFILLFNDSVVSTFISYYAYKPHFPFHNYSLMTHTLPTYFKFFLWLTVTPAAAKGINRAQFLQETVSHSFNSTPPSLYIPTFGSSQYINSVSVTVTVTVQFLVSLLVSDIKFNWVINISYILIVFYYLFENILDIVPSLLSTSSGKKLLIFIKISQYFILH